MEIRNEIPPESSWKEINERLDIEEAWDAISLELDKVLPVTFEVDKDKSDRRRYTFIRYFSIAASVALFVMIFMSDIRKSGFEESRASGPIAGVETRSPIVGLQSQRPLEGLETRPTSVGLQTQRPLEGLETQSPIVGLQTQRPNVLETLRPGDFEAGRPEPAGTTDGLELLASKTGLAYSATTGIKTRYTDLDAAEDRSFAENASKFSAGISVAGKNTWMLSQETFEGLSRHNLNSTKPNFLNDFGVILRYSLNERWSFEGSGFISSKAEQSYKQYLNGVYSDKTYELRYSSLELTASRALRKPVSGGKLRFSTVTGAYISYLHSAYKILNNSEYNVSTLYKPVDYGIILGTDIEIPFLHRFSVMPGFRFRYGIPNIFAGQQTDPGELRTTRNASLEFRLNIMLPFKNF